MTYIEGFVYSVPTANKEAFRKFAEKSAALFKKHGALQVVEGWGDDVPKGKVTDFYGAVKAAEDETVMFSWITWPDKAAREAGNAKVHEEMMATGSNMMDMPFDGKRMIYGGFEALVET